MSKVFERILYKQTETFMTTKFSPCLSGFRKNHNAQYSLLKMIKTWKKHLDKGEKNRGNTDGLLKDFGRIKS